MRYLLCLLCFFITLPAQASEITLISDIAYGTEHLQKLDIYQPRQCPEKGCPVVIWVHGGGWVINDKTDQACQELCTSWARLGNIVVSINYRLSPSNLHPAHTEDVAAAIAWTKQNILRFNGNPDRLYLLGHSAGAHLLALVSTAPEFLAQHNLTPAKDIRAVFAVDAAAYDLTRQRHILGELIDTAFGSDENTLFSASPLKRIKPTGQYPRFSMIAIRQRMLFLIQAQRMVEALQAGGNKAERLIIEYPNEHTELGAHMRLLRDLGDTSKPMTQHFLKIISEDNR
mgnify:CR=1 FL=1